MQRFIKWSVVILGIIFLATCEKFEAEPDADTFFHVRIEGTELPVWVRGNTASGKLLLYINGGPGLTSIDVARADMFGWATGMEESFAMVYYDQRGCGNAQGNLDEESLTLAQYVEDLDAIISVLQAKYPDSRIYLMGHSFGAFIGANYLLTDGLQEKVSGWITVDGAYNFDYDLSWQYRRTFLINLSDEEIEKGENVAHWEDALEWAEANPVITSREQKDTWRSFVGWPGGIVIPEETAELSVGDYLKIGFASSYNPFPAYVSSNLKVVNNRLNEDAEGKNLISAVSGLTLPSLFIWGRYDDLIVPEGGMDVFQNLGTSGSEKYFELLPESSHEPYISDPENFQEMVIEFVERY